MFDETRKTDITYVNEKFELINNGAIPTGAIVMWSGITAPNGWMICNGNPHPKTGQNVLDLRGRFVVGYDSTEGSGYTSIGPGKKFPNEYNITLSPENIPSHNHKNGIADDIDGIFIYGATEIKKEDRDVSTANLHKTYSRPRLGGYT